MTLQRITERIDEAKLKSKKLDGRRFNIRSKNKMHWEMMDIDKSLRHGKRKNPSGLVRGVYTKAEMEEYKLINKQHKEQLAQDRLEKEKKELQTRTGGKE